MKLVNGFRLQNITYSCYIATLVILAIFIQGDKESIALLEDHDESVSERLPAFLNRMRIFKVEFEKIKVSVYTRAHM